jgi:hypothetical protein
MKMSVHSSIGIVADAWRPEEDSAEGRPAERSRWRADVAWPSAKALELDLDSDARDEWFGSSGKDKLRTWYLIRSM